MWEEGEGKCEAEGGQKGEQPDTCILSSFSGLWSRAGTHTLFCEGLDSKYFRLQGRVFWSPWQLCNAAL